MAPISCQPQCVKGIYSRSHNALNNELYIITRVQTGWVIHWVSVRSLFFLFFGCWYHIRCKILCVLSCVMINFLRVHLSGILVFIIPTATKLGGVYWIDPVCLFIHPPAHTPAHPTRPLTFCVHPVPSTVPDGFFPYLVQIINSMRECVAFEDPWPWPISSKSFSLDLENRVRSVASTVLDEFVFIFGTNDN